MFFFFQAEDGIRDLVRSRGLGDVYKRQGLSRHSRERQPARQGSRDSRQVQGPVRRGGEGLRLSLIHI